jgi:hypothetical protein
VSADVGRQEETSMYRKLVGLVVFVLFVLGAVSSVLAQSIH